MKATQLPLILHLTATLLAFSAPSASAAIHYVNVDGASPMPPFTNWTTAALTIQDSVDAAAPGDQILVTNGIYQTGGRVVYGGMTNRVAVDRAVTVQSVNGAAVTVIQGFQVPGTTNGNNAIRSVYLSNGAALVGFTLTKGATGSSGDDLSEQSGGGVWCESSTAVVSNCVLAGNSASSIGGGAVSGTLNACILTGNAACFGGGGSAGGILNDCVITANWGHYGGGAAGSTLNRCTVAGNLGFFGGGAFDSRLNNCALSTNLAGNGGGVSGGTANNCVIEGNMATGVGGGAVNATLDNCTVTANAATPAGGGVVASIVNSCIVYYNKAPNEDNFSGSFLSYSCTFPLPANGIVNVASPPLFMDVGSGNLRLQSNSPCINAGSNAWMPVDRDLDGNPRIIGGKVDIGAYEFQSPTSSISFAWLQQYGLALDGSADFVDADGDGMNNWQEWQARTDPTDKLSVLRLLSLSATSSNITVSWQSVPGVNYFLERSGKFDNSPPFFAIVASRLASHAVTTSFSDTNTAGLGPFFYRVGVE